MNRGSILVSCNVKSLYSSISHKHGLQAIRYFMETESDWDCQFIDFMSDLVEFCLNHNFFVFHDKFYLQVKGVVMGAASARPMLTFLWDGGRQTGYLGIVYPNIPSIYPCGFVTSMI
ncbi:hypothetical protein XELAEV_18000701mg [Xenopus laevis]|uniref:Reverse transcriptase domain-containing protein n=1 Tax=Xenopus laevis TaxID=8355 RepID=A0A974GYS3_XENLA|nr:hypothetical protein XELAEV_18000701mg [Xenopus laevis]